MVQRQTDCRAERCRIGMRKRKLTLWKIGPFAPSTLNGLYRQASGRLANKILMMQIEHWETEGFSCSGTGFSAKLRRATLSAANHNPTISQKGNQSLIGWRNIQTCRIGLLAILKLRKASSFTSTTHETRVYYMIKYRRLRR